jgi:hypothetical protein
MGFAITAAAILVLCLIAAGLVKHAEARGDTIARQNPLEASRDSQLQDNQGQYEPHPAEDTGSEDFINLEQHWGQ